MTEFPQLLTVFEVAELLRRHPETIRRWVRDGDLSVVRTPSGQMLFRREDIEALLSSSQEDNNGERPISEQVDSNG